MRKLIFLMITILSLALAACSGETTSTDSGSQSSAQDTQEANNETATNEENTESQANDNVIELNQLIVDNENIKATLARIERKSDSIFGDSIEVVFEVENKREDTITVQAREVSVDNKMVDESMIVMSQDISGGKMADAVLTIQDFEGKGLPSMEENFEMLLHVFSWDDMDFQEDHEVKVSFK